MPVRHVGDACNVRGLLNASVRAEKYRGTLPKPWVNIAASLLLAGHHLATRECQKPARTMEFSGGRRPASDLAMHFDSYPSGIHHRCIRHRSRGSIVSPGGAAPPSLSGRCASFCACRRIPQNCCTYTGGFLSQDCGSWSQEWGQAGSCAACERAGHQHRKTRQPFRHKQSPPG